MTLNVVPFFGQRARSLDWSQQELAEFYRVESALIQGGLKLETDRGITDEGDPWFVFCQAETGEPVVHFARIDHEYIIASPAFPQIARGRDFRALVMELISRHKLLEADKRSAPNIILHPAALLIAVVGTAFFKVSDVHASPAAGVATDAVEGSNLPLHKSFVSIPLSRDYMLVALTAAACFYVSPIDNNDPVFGVIGDSLVLSPELEAVAVRSERVALLASEAQQHEAPASTLAEPIKTEAVEEAIVLTALLKDIPSDAEGTLNENRAVTSETATGALALQVLQASLSTSDEKSPVNLEPEAIATLARSSDGFVRLEKMEIVTANATETHVISLHDITTVLSALGELQGSHTFQAVEFLFEHASLLTVPQTEIKASQDVLNAPSTTFSDQSLILTANGFNEGLHISVQQLVDILKVYIQNSASLIIEANNVTFTPKEQFQYSAESFDSMIVHFQDGSSISLMGQPAALLEAIHGIA